MNAPSPTSERAGWWWAAVCFTGVLALVGVAQPRTAVAAALLAGLGVTAGVVAYLGWQLSKRLGRQPRSEFAPAVHRRPPQVLPHHVAAIAPEPGQRNPPLTSGARAGLVTVATERLWARHGLNVHDPMHHAQIERLLSADLWSTIRPERVDARGNLVPRARLLHRDLERLLDDLESI